jgi:hypothetical protein
MKRLSKVLGTIIALAACSTYVLAYVGGLRGMPLSIAGFPAEVIPFLASLFCLACLLGSLTIAFFKRKPAGGISFVLGISFLLFALGFAISPAKVFRAGFRRRIQSSISPYELRQIAHACHQILPPDKFLPGPEKWSLSDESQYRAKWQKLTESTAVDRLDPWLVIFDHGDTVELSWGGALIGHWGLIIQTGDKTEPGDVDDGIKTFIGPD